MDAIETILTRRSIRHFSSTPISDEEVHTLLKAAMFAPSAGNTQPWHFVVISDRALLDAIPTFHTASSFIKEAPLAILVCADEDIARPGRWMMDCSAAAENILLAAHALGLGACWIGIQPEAVRIDGILRLIRLPEEVLPLCLIAVGHALGETPLVDRFRPERVHHNHW
jgi:nitroreductase